MVRDVIPVGAGCRVRPCNVRQHPRHLGHRRVDSMGSHQTSQVILFIQDIPASVPPIPRRRAARRSLPPFAGAVVMVGGVALGREIGRYRRKLVPIPVSIAGGIRAVRLRGHPPPSVVCEGGGRAAHGLAGQLVGVVDRLGEQVVAVAVGVGIAVEQGRAVGVVALGLGQAAVGVVLVRPLVTEIKINRSLSILFPTGEFSLLTRSHVMGFPSFPFCAT